MMIVREVQWSFKGRRILKNKEGRRPQQVDTALYPGFDYFTYKYYDIILSTDIMFSIKIFLLFH